MNIRTETTSHSLLAAIAGTTLSIGIAQSQTTFTAHEIVQNGASNNSVMAVDIDGDGDTDVVSTAYGFVHWHENDGNQVFIAHEVANAGSTRTRAFAADIDGDTDIDIVYAYEDDNLVGWAENRGGNPPFFLRHTIMFDYENMRPSDIFVADIDDDGDADVLTADSGLGIVVFENDGGAGFTRRVIASAFAPWDISTADFDNDGDLDVLTTDPLRNEIGWLENDGSGSFTPRLVATASDAPISAVASDVDGDGDQDVLAVSGDDSAIRWHENLGGTPPTFAPRDIFSVLSPSDVFGLDFDGDGDTDVVSSAWSNEGVWWHENDGSSPPNFTTHALLQGPTDVVGVSAADMDGDGDNDILAASFSGPVRWFENGQFGPQSVGAIDDIINMSAGTTHTSIGEAIGQAGSGDALSAPASAFAAETSIDLESGFGARSLSLAGRGQLVIENGQNITLENDEMRAIHGQAAGFLQHGAAMIPIGEIVPASMRLSAATLLGDNSTLGSATDIEITSTGQLSTAVGASVTIDAPKGALIRGDIDFGAASLVDLRGGDVVLALEAVFATGTDIGTTASAAKSVRATDIDGDGDTDVVGAVLGDNAFRWYENNGAVPPAFTTHDIDTSAPGAISIAPWDMDGDGDMDIVGATVTDDAVRWYENDGAQSFTRHDIFIGGDGVNAVVAVDLDGDADVDVVSASLDDDYIRWHENTGNEVFVTHDLSTTTDGAASVYAIDVDGDLDMDVVTAAANGHAIAWLENDGQTPPTFTQRDVFVGAEGAISVVASDIDGDGDVDMASASQDDGMIRWYQNNGNEAFTMHVLAAAPSAQAVHAVDADNDGDIDIFSASPGDDIIRWFENDGGATPAFTAHQIATGGAPFDVTVADVDGDGDLDALGALFGVGAFRLYDNTAIASSTVSGNVVVATEGDFRNGRPLTAIDSFFSAGGSFINRSSISMVRGAIEANGPFTNAGHVDAFGVGINATEISNNGTLSGFGIINGDFKNKRFLRLGEDTQVVGDYMNDGETIIQNGMLVVFGGLTNNGTILGEMGGFGPRSGDDDPDGLFVQSDLVLGAASSFRLPALGSLLSAGGGVDIAINDHTRFDLADAEVKMIGLSGAQSLEVMSKDIGIDPAGLDRTIAGHYPLRVLRVGPTSTIVELRDAHDNANDGQSSCEAIYVRELVVEVGATLNTNGCRIYYEIATLNGAVDDLSNLVLIPPPCEADIVEPFGQVNILDLLAFLSMFYQEDSPADVAAPFGSFDIIDVLAYLAAYFSGCD